MAITIDDFNKIWASTSPLTPYTFSDANYKQGWNFIGATPPARQMWDSWLKMTDEKCQYLYNHEDVPVGHEYFTFNPNIPQGSLPLFGGEYSRETYSVLWNWVQEQTGYLKTEAEWQTLATANDGNVPYYSNGDGSTTFRVPSLSCWVKSANGTVSEVGSYLKSGLPNIVGSATFRPMTYKNVILTDGAFSVSDGANRDSAQTNASAQNPQEILSFNASSYNSIYGNSTTVQPPSVVGMWLVKAYGVVQDTGSINEQQYIDDRYNAMKTYVDGKFGVVDLESAFSVSVTSGNAVFSGEKYAKKIGNVMHIFFGIRTTTALAVRSTISCSLSGIPFPLIRVTGSSFYDGVCIVGTLNESGNCNIRLMAESLANNSVFGIPFVYPVAN